MVKMSVPHEGGASDLLTCIPHLRLDKRLASKEIWAAEPHWFTNALRTTRSTCRCSYKLDT